MTPKSRLFQKNAMPITPEAMQRLQAHGEMILDSATIGDYEFYLTKNRIFRGMPPQLGMQRTGQDFSSVEQQQEKTPQEKGRFSMKETKALLEKWLTQHPVILVGTHDPRKAAFYDRLLKALGFTLEKSDIAGHEVTVLIGNVTP